jgi:hypothetical protein
MFDDISDGSFISLNINVYWLNIAYLLNSMYLSYYIICSLHIVIIMFELL